MVIIMDEIKIYQRRSRQFRLLVTDILAIFMFYTILIVGRDLPHLFLIFAAMIGLIFSISCFIIIVCHLIHPKAILIINDKGIIDHSSIPVIGKIAWDEIADFYIGKMFKKEFICVELKDKQVYYSRMPFWKSWFIKCNTPKNMEPVYISMEAANADLRDVLELLMNRLNGTTGDRI
jgi:hypothetical protein